MKASRFLQPTVTAVVLPYTKSQCLVTSNPRETKKKGGEDCGALYALYFAFCVSSLECGMYRNKERKTDCLRM